MTYHHIYCMCDHCRPFNLKPYRDPRLPPMPSLADRIEARIRKIPCSNPAYIATTNETLGDLLRYDLLRMIAEEAAAECEKQQ